MNLFEDKVMSSFQREKRQWCGDYMIVDIFPRTKAQELAAKGTRKRTTEVSRPAQRNLNDKNSKKNFNMLANGNFGEGDYVVRYSYSNKNLPKTLEQAKKDISNNIERLKYELKKTGKDKELKWMCVTEFNEPNKKGEKVRIHHHLIINKVVPYDLIFDKWSKGRGKNKKKIGLVHVDKIQLTEDSFIENLVGYLFKNNRENRHWTASRNLERPKEKVTDFKYRRRKIEQLVYSTDEGKEYYEKMYPDHYVRHITYKENDFYGWQVSIKLRKRERDG